MTCYFLDSSALVKRYVHEVGTNWTRQIIDPVAGHVILVSDVSRVEVAAALAAKHRSPQGISQRQRNAAVGLLLRHCGVEYRLVAINAAVLDRAVTLTQNHRLRGYDAIQLSSALTANHLLLAQGHAGLVFVTADADLMTAAIGEGLVGDNPLSHP